MLQEGVREFHVGEIITVAREVWIPPNGPEGILALLNYMTDDNLYSNQVSRAVRECIPSLRSQHPDLARIAMPDFRGEQHAWQWLDEVVAEHGELRPVLPLHPDEHARIKPIEEHADMVGASGLKNTFVIDPQDLPEV